MTTSTPHAAAAAAPVQLLQLTREAAVRTEALLQKDGVAGKLPDVGVHRHDGMPSLRTVHTELRKQDASLSRKGGQRRKSVFPSPPALKGRYATAATIGPDVTPQVANSAVPQPKRTCQRLRTFHTQATMSTGTSHSQATLRPLHRNGCRRSC